MLVSTIVILVCAASSRDESTPSLPPSLPPSYSSYLHWKLVLGWLTIILLDSMVNFRFEYLYPAVMFIRSVYDSYKYQGLVSRVAMVMEFLLFYSHVIL